MQILYSINANLYFDANCVIPRRPVAIGNPVDFSSDAFAFTFDFDVRQQHRRSASDVHLQHAQQEARKDYLNPKDTEIEDPTTMGVTFWTSSSPKFALPQLIKA